MNESQVLADYTTFSMNVRTNRTVCTCAAAIAETGASRRRRPHWYNLAASIEPKQMLFQYLNFAVVVDRRRDDGMCSGCEDSAPHPTCSSAQQKSCGEKNGSAEICPICIQNFACGFHCVCVCAMNELDASALPYYHHADVWRTNIGYHSTMMTGTHVSPFAIIKK